MYFTCCSYFRRSLVNLHGSLIVKTETSKLMPEFYRNLQENSDRTQALRQAMLTTMQDHPHPRNWAAFTLIGARQ